MLGKWLRDPRQLRLVFLATMVLLSATLGWLGWHLLQQHTQLSAQGMSQRRETAADLAVAALEKRLSAVEQDLSEILTAGQPAKTTAQADEAVAVEFLPGAIRVWPHDHQIGRASCRERVYVLV